jgi:hypothetical protein
LRHRALQPQIRERRRLLGRKTLDAETGRRMLQHADPKKGRGCAGHCRRATVPGEGRRQNPCMAWSSSMAWSRPALKPAPARRGGRSPPANDELWARIPAIIAAPRTEGPRRVHALRRRQAKENVRSSPDHKRVWRIMESQGLLLVRLAGGAGRRHHNQGQPRSSPRSCRHAPIQRQRPSRRSAHEAALPRRRRESGRFTRWPLAT